MRRPQFTNDYSESFSARSARLGSARLVEPGIYAADVWCAAATELLAN